jgi:hypothetical protein
MTIAGRWREICRAPSDEGAGGGAGTGANDAGDPAGGAPGGEGAADGGEGTGDPAGAEGGDGAGGGEKPWHAREGSLTGPERDWLRARGMLTDDAAELLPKAIRGHMAAEKALGKGADKLMDRPKEGQAVAEWLRENGKAFGIPEAPDGYEVTKPDLPEGMSWDDGLEGQFRTLAHEQGMTPDQFNASIGLFANHMKGMFEGAALDGKTAEQEMRQELDRDWGDQYSAKVQLAQSAFQAIAAEAGLDHDQQLAAAFLLKPKVGDAGIMRMFAAIGAKMGDDGFVGGAGVPGVATPQEAKAELQRFMGSDGDYGKAFAAKDHKAMRALEGRRDQLTRMAASRG